MKFIKYFFFFFIIFTFSISIVNAETVQSFSASRICDEKTCYGLNTTPTIIQTYRNGITYRTRDNINGNNFPKQKYYYYIDDFSNKGKVDIEFTYLLTVDIQDIEYVAIANDVICDSKLTESTNTEISKRAGFIKYTCKNVELKNLGNNLSLEIELNKTAINTFKNHYFWISPITININPDFQNSQNVQNSINGVNDSITSSDIDNSNVSSTLNSVSFGDEGVITNLITMPITLYSSILNSINSQCSTFNLGSLFGVNLELPCVNLEKYFGSSLWTLIDILLSGFLIWGISRKIIKVFDQFTNLREGDLIND